MTHAYRMCLVPIGCCLVLATRCCAHLYMTHPCMTHPMCARFPSSGLPLPPRLSRHGAADPAAQRDGTESASACAGRSACGRNTISLIQPSNQTCRPKCFADHLRPYDDIIFRFAPSATGAWWRLSDWLTMRCCVGWVQVVLTNQMTTKSSAHTSSHLVPALGT